MTVTCGYCGKPALLVAGSKIYPRRPDLAEINFWECEPCEAFVGCHAEGSFSQKGGLKVYHDGTEPKGTLAKQDLRKLRMAVHAVLDKYWLHEESRRAARRVCYRRLAKGLGIPVEECHTGMFDHEMCGKAIAVIATWEKK